MALYHQMRAALDIIVAIDILSHPGVVEALALQLDL